MRAVPGAPAPVAFAEKIADALRAREVNATTLGGNHGSYLLTGEAHADAPADMEAGGTVRVTIDWLVSGPNGDVVGRHVQEARVAAEAWRGGETALTARLMEDAAEALAPMMADARAPSTAEPSLAVYGVDGAPGDGDLSLRRALAYALTQRGFRVVDGLDGADVVITGAVETAPAGKDRETVSITWSALRPDGSEIGVVRQSNRVPTGSLEQNWGVTAIHVAEAAAPGLARLIYKGRAGPHEASENTAGPGNGADQTGHADGPATP